ncbi:SusC/RagA family TonB-linked outer membrane protein [Chitinophaga sp. Cy-1792]|uniref:SusC/RagA family TonB-linked outer membrane protein n=1 Tax=Chitinophaga sp. Cy-1792 TaxID=2608339 RepID=UPI001421437C|nr:SusC/RagA family TonB-linked outer membrane protein [Chitinophaga sp. Cy-1792]NIG53432.1 SusC/RagA family TonB-linked outer membrane protein [Chitinophaga sp. Cy-1792]
MWTISDSCTRRAMLLLLVCLVCLTAKAQHIRITGKVTGAGNVVLPGVTVLVKGNNTSGTVTDASGNYSLQAPSSGILVFNYVGYTKKEVAVAGKTIIDVSLEEDSKQLGELVVTALGVKKEKKKLGYSVTEIKGQDLAVTNEISPVNALQGKVAGVQIDQGAGGLFGSTKILIRGNSTLGTNNQPIFVIDGVIMDNNTFSGTGRDFGNDLKNLNMEDFESVSVLKGSAAAALYGSRAINGVILITTKKGKQQRGIGVNVTQSYNVFKPYSGPDFQNEYGGGSVGAFFTDNRDPNYAADESWVTKVFPKDPVTGKPYIDRQINRELENWGPKFSGQDVTNYDGIPTKYVAQPNNFLDAFRTGKGWSTNIAMDGGNEKSTFRLSYTRDVSDGIVYKNAMTKNGFDLRVTHNINKWISADVGANYTVFNGKNPPRLGGLDAFGSYNFGKLFTWVLPRNYDTKYWMQQSKYVSSLGGTPNPQDPNETNKAPEARFWFNLFENDYLQDEQNVRGRIALTATLSQWAKLSLEGNVNNLYTRNENKELGQNPDFAGGLYGLGHTSKESYFLKWMLSMNKTFNKDLEVNGYIGGETQRYQTTYNYSETRGGLSYPGNYFIANSIQTPYTEGGIKSRKAFNSLYASADIAYKNQLFLLATWRGDWSSALTYSNGTGNNFYHYPAASLSWLFSETFKMPEWVTYGKFRTNIAALGKDTDPFTINPGFAFNGYTNSNGTDYPLSTYTRYPDPLTGSFIALVPNLKPERKIAKEVGMEMRFLKSRIGFDLSLYQDNTKNQIISIGTPQETGLEGIIINAGNIRNRGVELMVTGTPVQTKNFEWNTSFNYSHNKNLILDLYEGRNEYDLGANIGEISTWAIVGKSYGTLRTTIHSKAYQATDDNGKAVDNPNNGKPVLAWRSDARAAFPARSNTLQDVGDINAKFRGGWENTFRYKNFSLGVLLDAKFGGDFVMLTYRFGTHTGVFPNTLEGRDASHGGITWVSKYDGKTYDDGMIPDGVFDKGQKVTLPNGTSVDVGGMTYKEAYDKGLVEPTHAPQYYYRLGSSSTGVSDFWIKKNSWVSLRQVSLSYRFSENICRKLSLNNLSVAIVGRDLLYLYNTLPYNYNPASNNSNNTAFSGEQGFLPMMRSIAGTIRVGF